MDVAETCSAMRFDFDDIEVKEHSADELNFGELGDFPSPESAADDEPLATDDLLDFAGEETAESSPPTRPRVTPDEEELIRRGQDTDIPEFLKQNDGSADGSADRNSNFVPANAAVNSAGESGADDSSVYDNSPSAPTSNGESESSSLYDDLDPSQPIQSATTKTTSAAPLTNANKDEGLGWWAPLLLIVPLLLIGGLWAILRNKNKQSAVQPIQPIEPGPKAAKQIDMTKLVDPDSIPEEPEAELEPVMPSFAETPLHEPVEQAAEDTSDETVAATSDIPEWMQWEKESKTAETETKQTAETTAETTWEAVDETAVQPTADESTTVVGPESEVVESTGPPVPAAELSAAVSSFAGQSLSDDESDSPAESHDLPQVIDSQVAEAPDSRIQELETEIASLHAERSRFAEELESSRYRIGQLEQASHQNYATVEGLTRQRDGAVEQLSTLQSDYERLKAEFEASSSPTVDVDAITAEKDAAISKVAELENTVASLQAAIQVAEAAVSESHEKLAAAESAVGTTVNEGELNSALEERDRLASELSAANDELTTVKDELATAKTALENFEPPPIHEQPDYVLIVQDRDRLANELSEAKSELENSHAKLEAAKAAVAEAAEASEPPPIHEQPDYILVLQDRDRLANELADSKHELASVCADLETAKSAAAEAAEPPPIQEQPDYIMVAQERDRLASELSTTTSSLSAMQQMIDRLPKTVDDFSEYLAVQEERNRLAAELSAANEEVAALHKSIKEVEDISVLEDPEYIAMAEERDQLTNECNELQRVIQMREDTVNRLNQELDSLQNSYQTAERKMTQSELELESAHNRIAQLEESNRELALKAGSTEELHELRDQAAELQSSMKKAMLERDEAISRLSEAAVIRDELELRIASSQSRLADYESQVQEVAPLRARIAELESRMQSSGTDVERFESERSDLLEQLQAALQRSASLESTLRETEAEMAMMLSSQTDLEPLNAELESQRERLAVQQQSLAHRDEQLQSIQSQFDSLKSEYEAIRERSEASSAETETTIGNLKVENQKLEEAVAWLEREKNDSQDKLRDLESAHESTKSELESIRTELQEVRAKASARAEVASQHSQEQIARLSTERDTAIKAWGRAEQRLTDLQGTMRDHELAIQRLENDNERLARHLEELQTYRVQLEKSLQDTEQRLSTAVSEQVGNAVGDGDLMVHAELENTKQMLAVVTREKQQVLDWLEQSKQENRQLHDSAMQREQSIKEIQHEREALHSMLENRTASADHESRKLSQLREELRVVRQQRDELEQSNEELKRQEQEVFDRPPIELQHSMADTLEVVDLDDGSELLDLRNQLRDRDIELSQSQKDIVKLQRKLEQLEERISAPVRTTTRRKPAKQKSPATRKPATTARAKRAKTTTAKKKTTKATPKKATKKKSATRVKTAAKRTRKAK